MTSPCVSDVQSRCVFLINCGANLNLEEFLGLSDYAGLVLTVVDSHRPLDLNNIQEQDEDSPFEVWTRLLPFFFVRPALFYNFLVAPS